MEDIKQLLPWKGTFLLQHVLNRMEELGTKRTVVVLGANFHRIASDLKPDFNRTDIVKNPTWDKGLGNSISAGVKYLRENYNPMDGILICLADQPLITNDYLSQLMSDFLEKHVFIVASNYGNKIGVPAIFGPELFDELLDLDSDYGAREILRKHQSGLLGLDAQGLLADLDTPTEYKKLYNENHQE